MIFTLVPLIFFPFGAKPRKKMSYVVVHTRTHAHLLHVYIPVHAHARLRAGAHTSTSRAQAHDRNLRRRRVCARTRPPGPPASNKNGVVLCLL